MCKRICQFIAIAVATLAIIIGLALQGYEKKKSISFLLRFKVHRFVGRVVGSYGESGHECWMVR